MKILEQANDLYRVTLSPSEAQIFINCMNEAVKQLGGWEFQTRMGATEPQIQNIVGSLAAALK